MSSDMSQHTGFVQDEKSPRVAVNGVPESEVEPYSPSLLNRLGLISTLLFYSSSVLILGCMSFLAFLWFADSSYYVWHQIMIHDWCLKAISFTSTAIRWAITIQTSTCLSMLAALAMEKFFVPHPAVAAVSIMRVGGTGLVSTIINFIVPLTLGGYQGSVRRMMRSSVFSLVIGAVLILTTSTALQFTSTFLLSDVSVKVIPSKASRHVRAIDFGWNYTSETSDDGNGGSDFSETYGYPGFSAYTPASIWTSNRPSTYATFAEYKGDAFVHENVSDTGVNLRALLPLGTSEERTTLRTYSGKALVLDSRVTCQMPVFHNLNWTTDYTGSERIFGKVTYSVKTPQLDPPTTFEFECPIYSYGVNNYTICQLQNDAIVTATETNTFPNGSLITDYDTGDWLYFPSKYAGGLQSEFRIDNTNKSGAAFLVLSGATLNKPGWFHYNRETKNPLGHPYSMTSSLTLCYAALDTADRHIEASSAHNRSEPVASYSGTYNYSEVALQMNPLSTKSVEDRGILTMAGQNWTAPLSLSNLTDGPVEIPDSHKLESDTSASWHSADILPYITGMLQLSGMINGQSAGPAGNCSVLLGSSIVQDLAAQTTIGTWSDVCYMVSQPWLADLFQYMMEQEPNGNVAVALQAVFTTIASMAFYDKLPEFDKMASSNETYWIGHNTPGGMFGTRRDVLPKGFVILAIILGYHLLTVLAIFRWFMADSRLSRIGDPWQAIAHVASGNDIREHLDQSLAMNTDRQAAARGMEHEGTNHTCVGIQRTQGGAVVLARQHSD